MAENLFCKDQKAATDKFRNGFDNIRWDGNNDMKIPVNGTVFYDGRCVGQLYPINDKNIKDLEPEFSKDVGRLKELIGRFENDILVRK